MTESNLTILEPCGCRIEHHGDFDLWDSADCRHNPDDFTVYSHDNHIPLFSTPHFADAMRFIEEHSK